MTRPYSTQRRETDAPWWKVDAGPREPPRWKQWAKNIGGAVLFVVVIWGFLCLGFVL